MLVSAQTKKLRARFGMENAIRILHEAGFDAYDWSMGPMEKEPDHELNQPNYREYAHHIRKFADSLGIVCNQAHAPTPSSYEDPTKTADVFQKIVRAIEVASIVGAKNINVHPCQHLHYKGNEKELLEINRKFLQTLVPYAEKFNINITVENMWQHYDGRINYSPCADPEEHCAYVDMASSSRIGALLDIGHSALVIGDPTRAIRALGPRLYALHVHDNDLIDDLHHLPFSSKIDFDAVAAALQDIGYSGDMTLECDGFIQDLPEELIADAARFMCQTGRCLAAKVTSK